MDPLNPLVGEDLLKEVKYTYSEVDADGTNNTKPVYNSYMRIIPSYVRASLRYVCCYFTLFEEGREVDQSIKQLLAKLEAICELSMNFIIPISFRVELQYLFALCEKFSFYKEVYAIQEEYIKK